MPAYYERDKNGLPKTWVDYVKNTIAKVASNFTTHRMLLKIKGKQSFTCERQEGNVVTYAAKFIPDRAGIYFAGIRIFASNPYLPHRQDFSLVRWI